jgi:hypothetical protein
MKTYSFLAPAPDLRRSPLLAVSLAESNIVKVSAAGVSEARSGASGEVDETVSNGPAGMENCVDLYSDRVSRSAKSLPLMGDSVLAVLFI